MSKAVIDSREDQKVKKSFSVEMQRFEQLEAEVEELDQGDFYLPECDVVVERKEASDFASSLTDGRLSEQADRMAANHDHVFLVIEGSPYDLKYSDVSGKSVTGMQTSLAVKRDVHILFTNGVMATHYAVGRVFQRFLDGEHREADTGYVKTADTGEVDDVQVAMLMQIDGISKQKARDILDQLPFDTLAYNSAAQYGHRTEISRRLKKVDGVGDTLAWRIIDVFQ